MWLLMPLMRGVCSRVCTNSTLLGTERAGRIAVLALAQCEFCCDVYRQCNSALPIVALHRVTNLPVVRPMYPTTDNPRPLSEIMKTMSLDFAEQRRWFASSLAEWVANDHGRFPIGDSSARSLPRPPQCTDHQSQNRGNARQMSKAVAGLIGEHLVSETHAIGCICFRSNLVGYVVPSTGEFPVMLWYTPLTCVAPIRHELMNTEPRDHWRCVGIWRREVGGCL